MERVIAHLNIVGFRAAVAALRDPSLRGRPFVVAGSASGRALAWDVSPQALKEGITVGMALSSAQRLVKGVTVVPPDITACRNVNAELEKIINRYAPQWQNDGAGNIFLDMTGTARLFGAAPDCVCRIQNEIISGLSIEAAAATATNKLVCKVASRTIRPEGLIEVRPGDEETFLSRQDIALLPGLGPSLQKTIRVTGFREIRELAALTNAEAISLFGRRGILLRDTARGIDDSPVITGVPVVTGGTVSDMSAFSRGRSVMSSAVGFARLPSVRNFTGDFSCPTSARSPTDGDFARSSVGGDFARAGKLSGIIEKRADFAEDVLDEMIIRGALVSLAEHAGLEIRKDRLGASSMRIGVTYGDGVEASAKNSGRLLALDSEIISAAELLLKKVTSRRVRIRSISLSMGNFSPLAWQPDLFVDDVPLQRTVDKIRNRYGQGAINRALVLAASGKRAGNHAGADIQ